MEQRGERKTKVQDAISLRNQQESPLLRLPGELRTKIYEHALGGLELCVVEDYSRRKRFAILARRLVGTSYLESTKQLLALTASCRQINTEAKLLPYTINEFAGCFQYLKPLITGGLFDSNLVLVIAKMRMFVGHCDLEDHGDTFRLRRPLTDMFLVFRGLSGLKRVTLEWTGTSSRYSWEYIRERLLEAAEWAFDLAPKLDHIEVEVVETQY